MLSRKIKALLYADVAWYLGEGMLGPLFAVFTERIGGDILNITWAWATYLIITGLFMVIIGKMSDRALNKKKLLFWGYVLNTILTFGYLFVDNPYSLLALQAGLGIAAAMATPTWNALYSEYENKRRDGYTWGLADGFSELFTGFAIIIGGFVVVYLSFTALFIMMGIVQVISVILLLPVLKK